MKALEYHKESSINVKGPDSTNRYAFGKIHVRIKGLSNTPNIGKLFFRIRMGPFILETRRMKGPANDRYKINQDFYLPVSNRYDILRIEIVSYITIGLF